MKTNCHKCDKLNNIYDMVHEPKSNIYVCENCMYRIAQKIKYKNQLN